MSVFEADAEGWRRMNSGRPAHELVREAVQNVFDEVSNGATKLEVEIEYVDGAVNFVITDDVPGGIRDERLIWTIWASDKEDSANKRGRMGRGLKELISVADWSLIVTEGRPAVQFKRYRGNWKRTSPRKVRPKAGTVLEGRVKLWGARDARAIVDYLKRMRPPTGLTFTVKSGVNERIERSTPTETYTLKLPTVVFEPATDGERVERNPRRETTVELIAEQPAWIYEMGIPVEETDYPFSIDIGQRIPLREKRDTLTDPYRRELLAKLLDARSHAGRVDHAQMRDNHVLIAAQAPEHLSERTKKDIAHAWTNGLPYATTSEVAKQATGQHIPVMPLRQLPQAVREIAKEVGTDAKQLLEEMAVASCATIPAEKHTPAMARLVSVWEWIASGINRSCVVHLSTGRPSASASFNRKGRVLTVFVENSPDLVRAPLAASSLATLIHELAHWRAQDDDAHGREFHSDAEDVGGAVAAFLLNHAEDARHKQEQ